MDGLFWKIAMICVAFLIIILILTIRQMMMKRELILQKERLQEIIEEKNMQMHELAAQNRVFGDMLKDSLQNESNASGFDMPDDKDSSYVMGKSKYLKLVLDLEKISCEKNNIDFRTEIDVDCDMLPFSEADIVSLFCNILDNAIEACKGIRGFVFLSIKNRVMADGTNGFEILVENSKKTNARPLEDNFATHKMEKDIHGRGVSIIKDIVRRYHGHISWDDRGDSFVTRIWMEI